MSRAARRLEQARTARHEPGWVSGSHTGSALRLLSRSVLELLLGVMVPGQLAIGGGFPCPVEVRLQVARGADLSGPRR